MRIHVDEPLLAWLPLTLRGVAAFAHVSLSRVLLAQLLFVAAAAVAFALLIETTWFATIRETIATLPLRGQIQRGELVWPHPVPTDLASSRFLKFSVDPAHSGELGQESDVAIELGRTNIWIISLLGYLEAPYPDGWSVALNRADLEPWWGAREPFLVIGAGVAMGAVLLVLGWALGTIYAVLAWVLAFLANRSLSLTDAWKLAVAAQLPGALLLLASFLSYRLGWLSLLHLLLSLGLSLAVAWFYVICTPFLLPAAEKAAAAKANPFTAGQPTGTPRQPEKNPFRR